MTLKTCENATHPNGPGLAVIFAHPDVLLFVDGEVGVQINHLWGPVGRRSVPRDL